MRIRHMGQPDLEPGYALILTLIVLALMASILGAMARISATRAGQAVRAERALQTKWGIRTMRDTIRVQADALINKPQATDVALSAIVTRLTLKLGDQGMTFNALLADEQAKVNVNHLLTRYDTIEVTQKLTELAATSDEPWTIQLNAHVPQQALNLGLAPLDVYGRVFAQVDYASSLVREYDQRLPIDNLTCWGDGPLHLRRTSDQAIRTMLRDLVDTDSLEALIGLHHQSPDASLGRLLATLDLTARQRARLAPYLTETSTCYSIMMTVQSDRRLQHNLWVYSGKISDHPIAFIW